MYSHTYIAYSTPATKMNGCLWLNNYILIFEIKTSLILSIIHKTSDFDDNVWGGGVWVRHPPLYAGVNY